MNVEYGGAALQKMDVYPSAFPASPIVMFFHSGGWVEGDKSGFKQECEALQAAGFTVFCANYRLAQFAEPKVEAFPMEVEDCQAATEYAMAHASTYSAISTNVKIVCGSAGGQLGAMVALRMNGTKAGTIKSFTWLSGAGDLQELLEEKHGFGNDLAEALGCKEIGAETEAAPKKALAELWSPERHMVAAFPPAQLFESSGAELMPKGQYEGMKEAILAAGGTVAGRLVAAGAQHAFTYWGKVEDEIIAFLRAN